MYALVQFLAEKHKAIVPVKSIKNFNSYYDEIDLSRAYKVFWRLPNGEEFSYRYAVVLLVAETPELVKQKRKQINLLHLTRLSNLLAVTLEGETKKSVAAEETQEKCKVTFKGKNRKQSTCEKKKSKPKLKKRMRSPSRSSDDEPSTSSDGGDLVSRLKLERMAVKYEKVRRKLKRMKEKHLRLEEKYDLLQEHNITMQKHLLPLLTRNDTEMSMLESEYERTNSQVLQSEENTHDISQKKQEVFELDDLSLVKAYYRVKPGTAGDSMFVKNLSMALFEEEVLCSSSVTGAKCNAIKDSVPKPALCPFRIEYIKNLLHARILSENPDCTSEEMTTRLNKVNLYIGEKIVTLLRKKRCN